MKRRRILFISYGEFSGISASIVSALRGQGFEVVEAAHSLRHLRFRSILLLLMVANAIIIYRTRFRRYLHRTPMANWVHSWANQVIANKHGRLDAVITAPQILGNHLGAKLPKVRYAILTDHVNLLSKAIPDVGVEFAERGVSDVWNEIEQDVLSQQDEILVLGGVVKSSLIKDYGIDPNKIAVIGAGPNLDVDAERDCIEKDFSQQNILFVGLQTERKGLPVLERAFKKVAKEFPQARLHVVGVDGVSAGGVIYHGILRGEPLKKLFYSTQIFSLPSLREPFGIVFLEAMWSKNVCIGTTLCAMPEIIEQGHSGFVIQPQNEDELAERIIELFNNPVKMEQMAEAGYQKAKSKYTWEKCAKRIADALFEDGSVVSDGGYEHAKVDRKFDGLSEARKTTLADKRI